MSRQKRISVLGFLFCIAGWTGWTVALFLPAVESEIGTHYAMVGAECLFLSSPLVTIVVPLVAVMLFPFFLANMVTLASPFVFFRQRVGRVPAWMRYVSLVAFANPLYLLWGYYPLLHPGAFVWSASCISISLGLWVQHRFMQSRNLHDFDFCISGS